MHIVFTNDISVSKSGVNFSTDEKCENIFVLDLTVYRPNGMIKTNTTEYIILISFSIQQSLNI